MRPTRPETRICGSLIALSVADLLQAVLAGDWTAARSASAYATFMLPWWSARDRALDPAPPQRGVKPEGAAPP